METLPMILIGVCVILVVILGAFMSSNKVREFVGIKCPVCPVCPPQKECPTCPPAPTVVSAAQKACPPCPAAPVCPVGNPLMIGIKYKELDNAFLNNTSKLVNKYLDQSLKEACKTIDISAIPKYPSGVKCSDFDKEFDKTVLGIDPTLPPGEKSKITIPQPMIDFLVELRPEMKKKFCKSDGTVDNLALDKTIQDVIKMFCN